MRKPLPAEIAEIIPTIKANPRPFHNIAIVDCGEPLVSLETGHLYAFENPHPYLATGAPYGKASPFMLRKTVAEKLAAAQALLAQKKAGWRLKVFDGFRPLDVQAHMVAFTFIEVAQEYGFDALNLDDAERAKVLEKVYRIWSPPNRDPKTPPPHSTGAAVDCTLVDEQGRDVDMGSPIDFNADISNPDYFAKNTDEKSRAVHTARTLLRDVMQTQGFIQHPEEWWHYSYGDQLWVWLRHKNGQTEPQHAIYGRVMDV